MTKLREREEVPPLLIDLPVISKLEIKLEESDWWNLGGYDPQPIYMHWHGWAHGPRCLPPFRIIATLAMPKRHPFIRENNQEQREHEFLIASEMKPSIVRMNLASVSIDEMEKEFLEAALPRLRDHGAWAFGLDPCQRGFIN